MASPADSARTSFAKPKSSTLTRPSLVTIALAGQVAMDDSFLMRRGQRLGQRTGNLEDLLDRQSARGNQPIERLPLDQFHR